MRKFRIKRLVAVILSLIALVFTPAPVILAAEPSILAGDEEIENWVREMQAEILFFMSPSRANELGGIAFTKASEQWAKENKWAERYVLIHSHLAMTNLTFDRMVDVNGQPANFPDKDEYFNMFFTETLSSLDQAGEMQVALSDTEAFSQHEKNMIHMLVDATRGRIFCYMSRAFANAPDGIDQKGVKAFSASISRLQAASEVNTNHIIEGAKLAKIDFGHDQAPNSNDLVALLEEQRDATCGQ